MEKYIFIFRRIARGSIPPLLYSALILLIGLASGTGISGGNTSTITTESLYLEMTDLHRLVEFPHPAYRIFQFSSFDRRSQLPGGPDWFANSDGFGGEPIPGFERILQEPDSEGIGEYLIADVKGPGAIVRLWSAAISGTIDLYLDDQETPVYAGSAIDFFHRTLDAFPQVDSLNRERLNETVYQRDASYAPIPYAKRMRLIWTGDLKTIHFYQVQVRMYNPETIVKTFSPQDLETYRNTIEQVMAELIDPDQNLKPRSQQIPAAFESSLEPGESAEVITLNGPAALELLQLRVEAEDVDLALRQTVVYINCDDYPWGHVQSPLGDFFGAAPGINPYRSLPFSVQPDGTMISRWVMPFKNSLKLRLSNTGRQKVKIIGSALSHDYIWNEARSMHFRARWRVDHDMVASNRDVQDLPFLLAHGQGLYVGTTSYLLNPNNVPTPYGNWWGEGDEKVFVDDDITPSIFGTGSEDYYNYSWSSPDIFFFPYCGQPRNDGPGNRGFVTNFRWHILDPIPFRQHIRFFMELYSHEITPHLAYARIGYHYARPGLTDDHAAIKPSDLRPQQLPENWRPAARMGARNSVMYPAENLLTEHSNTHFLQGRIWAEGKLLIWTPKEQGETKDFVLRVDTQGKYRIYITAALTPRSGRFSVLLNGKPLPRRGQEENIDLFRPHRTLLRNYALQEISLKPGDITLSLVFNGARDELAAPEIGIDFIWIQTLEQ
jgi:hypothetical protein